MKLTLRSIAPLLALLLILAPPVLADEAKDIEPYEAWFVMNMGGQKAGHMHITLKQDGDRLVSTTEMKIAIKRGAAEMTVTQSTRFEETLDYKPIAAESAMALGAMVTAQRLDFTAEQGKWQMTTTTAGQKQTTTLDPPDVDWLTPGALAQAMEDALKRGDKEITLTTLDLSMGTKPVTMTMKRGADKDIEVFGKVVPATKWVTTITAMPGMAIEQWTDGQGQPVRQVVPMLPGMDIEMLLADKQLALADFDAPEMLAASLITPDKAIKNPRKLSMGAYTLHAPGLRKSVGDVVPGTSTQSVQWQADDTLYVQVSTSRGKLTTHKTPELKPYLTATSMLNHDDPAVQQLLKKVGPIDNAQQAITAKAIRDFVREHIDEKDLSVGFASASETARTGQGDCTEHACLLAAMLRGAGVPSRTVTGLVYADQFAGHEGVFGFHMWTQAWIATEDGKGYWLDLDAAAPGEIDGFDATHIALSTSAMKDDEGFNDMVQMLPLMQGLKIKVVDQAWAE